MLDILLAVLSFNVLIVIFKFFDRLKINNLQALIVNYFVAALCSLYFAKQSFAITHILYAPWLMYAALVGFIFVLVFNLYALGTQKVGIAITTVANRLSLFIPVGFALIYYPNEHITVWKLLGFVLAALGIYFTTTNSKKIRLNKKYLGLILLVFVGQGIGDTIFNYAQQNLVENAQKELFFIVLFMMAGISGCLLLFAKSFQKKQTIQLKSILGGTVFGIPNYASLLFFFNALENSALPASQVFPLVSMGIVVTSALLGFLFFKEKLSVMNWLGLGIAVISIYLISF